MAYHFLLVEDDAEIREIITDYFNEKSEGEYRIDAACSGGEGAEKTLEQEYDLIFLDIMLPELDGFTLCRELRKRSDVPIIFITARQGEDDKLHGYRLGCDDYISKPFSLAELYAKATALLRRAKGTVRTERITAGRIELNPHRCEAFVDGKELVLAPIEYAILKILMENRGRMVSRESLLLRIWGYDFEGDERVLDNHMKKLRKSLGEAAKQIKTVIKRGYKLED